MTWVERLTGAPDPLTMAAGKARLQIGIELGQDLSVQDLLRVSARRVVRLGQARAVLFLRVVTLQLGGPRLAEDLPAGTPTACGGGRWGELYSGERVPHQGALRQGEGNNAEQRRERSVGNGTAKSVGSGMLHGFLLLTREAPSMVNSPRCAHRHPCGVEAGSSLACLVNDVC